MNQSLQQHNSSDNLAKKQSLLSTFKNVLTKDLNKIAKKLPLPPMLKSSSNKKEFNRDKFLKILEKKQKYFGKLIYEIEDIHKLEKCRVVLSSLNLLLSNKDKVNDDEILEMYSKIRKGL